MVKTRKGKSPANLHLRTYIDRNVWALVEMRAVQLGTIKGEALEELIIEGWNSIKDKPIVRKPKVNSTRGNKHG